MGGQIGLEDFPLGRISVRKAKRRRQIGGRVGVLDHDAPGPALRRGQLDLKRIAQTGARPAHAIIGREGVRAERTAGLPREGEGEIGHGAHGDAPVRNPHPSLGFVVHHEDRPETLPVLHDAGGSEQKRPHEIVRFTRRGRFRCLRRMQNHGTLLC